MDDELAQLLQRAAAVAADYRTSLPDRPVQAPADPDAVLAAFGGPLPRKGTPPAQVVDELVAAAEGGLVAHAPARASSASSSAARCPPPPRPTCSPPGGTSARSTPCSSPAAAAAEEVAGALAQGAARPAGARRRSASSPAARRPTPSAWPPARHHVLAERRLGRRARRPARRAPRCGWSPARSGTPRSTGRCGCSASATARVEPVAADANGAIDVADLARVLAPAPAGPTIVCLQAGNVNTGACDDLRAALRAGPRARRLGARRRRVRAVGGGQPGDRATSSTASSWPTRGRATGTSGSTCRTTAASRSARTPTCTPRRCPTPRPTSSAPAGRRPAPADLTPGVVAPGPRLRRVGRAARARRATGVAELVERCCRLARRFADGLRRRRRARSPTTSCSTRCSSASATTPAPTR